MPNSANVNFNVINNANAVSKPLPGIFYVEGITKRGPFGKPEDIITSWSQFIQIFGGLIDNSDFPLIAKRALDAGAALRVNRLGHYTDIADASTLDAVVGDTVPIRVLTFSAALITGNVTNMTINGTAISAVTFATDSDTTMAAIATAIAGVTAYVQKAVVIPVTGGTSNDRVILVYPKTNTALTITSAAVTGGASQATITNTAKNAVIDSSNNTLFNLDPKEAGADYNYNYYTISNASNGSASYFKLTIGHSLESGITEVYDNLKIVGNPNVANSNYLLGVVNGSLLAKVTYADLSALTGQLRPMNGTYYVSGGSDGTAPAATDYAGDSAGKTGLFAFDDYDDGYYICAPEISTDTVHQAGAAYVDSRKDLIYLAHLDNTLTTATALNTERDGLSIDSPLVAFYAGGIKVVHPTTNDTKEISELGDVLGLAAKTHAALGPWRSFAGPTNGIITNSLGPVTNFGSQGQFDNLNLIANHQINMVINRDGKVQLSGNFTGDLDYSPESFLSVETMILYIKKSLRPTLSKYIEEPADIPTFKAIYYEVKPFFDQMVTDRALFAYSWEGDQDASSLDSLQVNNPTDVSLGKYKINLKIKPIASLQEITVNIILTAAGVSFQ